LVVKNGSNRCACTSGDIPGAIVRDHQVHVAPEPAPRRQPGSPRRMSDGARRRSSSAAGWAWHPGRLRARFKRTCSSCAGIRLDPGQAGQPRPARSGRARPAGAAACRWCAGTTWLRFQRFLARTPRLAAEQQQLAGQLRRPLARVREWRPGRGGYAGRGEGPSSKSAAQLLMTVQQVVEVHGRCRRPAARWLASFSAWRSCSSQALSLGDVPATRQHLDQLPGAVEDAPAGPLLPSARRGGPVTGAPR
jgi:hypothetical protein